MLKTSFILTFILALCISNVQSQTIDLVYLDNGLINGSCTSSTNCANDILCYGVQYTPNVTGSVTSYTFTFLGDCGGTSPFINGGSCVMTDNTIAKDFCGSFNVFQLSTSGNTGTFSIVKDVPVIMHQVCFNLPTMGGDINIMPDAISPAFSVSVDSAGSNNPVNDLPSFTPKTLRHSDCDGPVSCLTSDLCTVGFGSSDGKITFNTLLNGNVADASSLNNTFSTPQEVDVYNEASNDCTMSGGDPDLTITVQMLNTSDVNNNGIIDTLGSISNSIAQGSGGLNGTLAFNSSQDDESSSGDLRGYIVVVIFAEHLRILADQLSVEIANTNSPNAVFESASITFLDLVSNPFTLPIYNGFYNGTPDLSGACQMTSPASNAYLVTGSGTVVFESSSTVNINSPCLPTIGSANGLSDTILVNARTDAGLDSAQVIGGFRFIVLAEDISAPNANDMGIDPEHTAILKSQINNITTSSSLLGYHIDGCVFESSILAIDLLDFNAYQDEMVNKVVWSIEDEKPIDYFDVEWSKDGLKFSSLKSIKASNYSSQPYQYIHENPHSGNNYYRLKILDDYGESTYSSVRKVHFKITDNSIVYPNPFLDQIQIQSSNQINEVNLLNQHGHQIKSLFPKDLNPIQIDVNDILPGIYFLSYKIDDSIYYKKLIKL